MLQRPSLRAERAPFTDHINEFESHRGVRLLLDANVLIYVHFAPMNPGDAQAVDEYSEFYKDALAAGAELVVIPEVLSETYNRVLRYGHQTSGGHDRGGWKEWRISNAGQACAEDARHVIDRILDDAKLVSPSWEDALARSVVGAAVDCTLDWADSVLAHVAETQRMILVTHDADLARSSADITTSNPNLLRRRA